MFLGGAGSVRPFGDAVLDGCVRAPCAGSVRGSMRDRVDLDIEGGASTGYAAFVTQLRTHFAGASKKYVVSAGPSVRPAVPCRTAS
jgi:chitinase